MEKIPVAVLAATGTVGQRFVQLLDNHPWFKVVALTGSDRSIGKTYEQACHWVLPTPMPDWARQMNLVATEEGAFEARIGFSALPSYQALEWEPRFAKIGMLVCSNASAYRMEKDVPILIPEVNAEHIALIHWQRKQRGWSGAIITNSNCTSTGMTVALKALQDAFGVKAVFAVSMQALSGAGYPGVASLDILDNVLPYIVEEEEKVEEEPRKMLGTISNGEIKFAPFPISAHTNRVAVSEGHLVCLSVQLDKKASVEEIKAVLQQYQPPRICMTLPSTPKPVIKVFEGNDRPQPRLDRMLGAGMTTSVGRIRPDPIWDVKMVVLSHNTIRGAAGGSIYNAELAYQAGLI
ncbi:MAG: aspartate-semialdehyde dehydrogenase [Anaerolineales bacterium]